MFVQRFSATRRGARLARLLALHQLDAWGVPYGSRASGDVAAVVAELAANAVLHGRVPGRGFEVALTLRGPGRSDVLVEVTDTRGEAWPPARAERPAGSGSGAGGGPDGGGGAEGGRGLLIVEALSTGWGTRARPERAPGKTVWAAVRL